MNNLMKLAGSWTEAELREAELRAQRLDLYTDMSYQEEYEAFVENIQQKLSFLPCPSSSQ